jgi:hypothetical protein
MKSTSVKKKTQIHTKVKDGRKEKEKKREGNKVVTNR